MEAGLRRLTDLVGTCVTFAWWDGSCLGLRLHRLADLIEYGTAAPAPLPARVPGAGR